MDKQILVYIVNLYSLKAFDTYFFVPVVKIKNFKMIAADITANIMIYVTRIIRSLG